MERLKIHKASAFISSTFEDMKEERNIIMLEVAPVVKGWAYKHGIIFDVVDLRWGITDHQAMDLHHTIKICLQRVRDTDPLFICLLGDRYGWQPENEDFNELMFDKDISPYLKASATELEIWQALRQAFFDSKEKSSLFFVRNIVNYEQLNNDELLSWFNDDKCSLQKELRKNIKDKERYIEYTASFNLNEQYTYHINKKSVESYPLDNFKVNDKSLKDVMIESLIQMLRDKYQINEDEVIDAMNPVYRQDYQLEYLLDSFEIKDITDGINQKFNNARMGEAVKYTMPPASGLSTQAAHYIKRLLDSGEYFVIYRFIGIDYYSKNVNDIIRSIAYQLDMKNAFTSDLGEAFIYVKKKLEKISKKKKIVLAFDGANEKNMISLLNVISGFIYYKALIFLNLEMESAIDYKIYPDETFKSLIAYLLFIKGKCIDDTYLEKILSYAKGDLQILRLVINYLVKFGTYDTLNEQINVMVSLSKKELIHHYINTFNDEFSKRTGREHLFSEIFSLLAFTPLPLSISTIAGVMSVIYPNEDKELLKKDILYALALADDVFKEFNNLYIVRDSGLKKYLLLNLKLLVPSDYIYIALSNYYTRMILIDKINELSRDDLYLYLLSIPEVLSPNTQEKALLTLLTSYENFYRIILTVGKLPVTELVKKVFLALEGMHVPASIIKNDDYNMFNEVFEKTCNKYFSAKRGHTNNVFLYIYKMVMYLDKSDLKSVNTFGRFLRTWLDPLETSNQYINTLKGTLERKKYKIEEKENYFLYNVPKSFDLVCKSNTCVYNLNTYIVSHSAIFVMDTMSMETKEVVPIPAVYDKVLATIYRDHTLYVLTEKGLVILYNTITRSVDPYRYLNPYVEAYYFDSYNDGEYILVYTKDSRFIILKNFVNTVCDFSLPLGDDPYIRKLTPVIEDGKVTGMVMFFNENGADLCLHLKFENGKVIPGQYYHFGDDDINTYMLVQINNDLRFYDDNNDNNYILRYVDGEYVLDTIDSNEYLTAKCGNDTFTIIDDSIYLNGVYICPESKDMITYTFFTPMFIGYVNWVQEIILIDGGY